MVLARRNRAHFLELVLKHFPFLQYNYISEVRAASEPNNWNGVDESVAFMNLVHPEFGHVVDGSWSDGNMEFDNYQYPLCQRNEFSTRIHFHVSTQGPLA